MEARRRHYLSPAACLSARSPRSRRVAPTVKGRLSPLLPKPGHETWLRWLESFVPSGRRASQIPAMQPPYFHGRVDGCTGTQSQAIPVSAGSLI